MINTNRIRQRIQDNIFIAYELLFYIENGMKPLSPIASKKLVIT